MVLSKIMVNSIKKHFILKELMFLSVNTDFSQFDRNNRIVPLFLYNHGNENLKLGSERTCS